MSFNTSTGIITGKPVGLTNSITYTVTGTNSVGSDTFSFNMQVVPPKALWLKYHVGVARDIVVDNSNNYYTVIETNLNSDSIDLNGDGSVIIPATSSSATDVKTCIIKYNNAGTALWVKSLTNFVGGTTIGSSRIHTDSVGNIYVSYRNPKNTDGNVDINGDGSLILSSTTTTNADGMFVKYNSSGVAQWYKHLLPAIYITLHMFKVENGILCAVYRAGITTNIDINGNGSLVIPVTTNDRFLVVYDTVTGNALSYKILCNAGSGTLGLTVQDISVDSSGNIYISGLANNTSVMYLNAEQTISIPAISGVFDGFVIKYNSSLVPQWAKTIQGPSTEQALRCGTDLDENVYICGNYLSSSVIDLGNGVTLPVTINADGYLVKFDKTNGNALWAKTFTASDNPGTTTNLDFDSYNNIYITGAYNNVDPITISENVTLPGTVGFAFYIIKYNSSGTYVWHKSFDGNGTESGRSLAVDSLGQITAIVNVSNVSSVDINGDNTIVIPQTNSVTTTAVVQFGAF